MNVEQQPARLGAHLVGSLPVADQSTAWTVVANTLGGRLRRITDGETGARAGWVWSQVPVLARAHGLRSSTTTVRGMPDWPVFTSEPGRQITMGPLGYADHALAAFDALAAARHETDLDPRIRLQVSLPSPASVVATFVAHEARAEVEEAYEQALIDELSILTDRIPHDQLAVQWDCCAEILMNPQTPPIVTPWRPEHLSPVGDLSAQIPAEVEVGLHLCYGNYRGRRQADLATAAPMVEVANVCSKLVSTHRPLDFLHLPVRPDTAPEIYLAPLADLKVAPTCDIYLGVISDPDDTSGAWRRLSAGQRVLTGRELGVAAECGLGRREPDGLPALLRQHRTLSTPQS